MPKAMTDRNPFGERFVAQRVAMERGRRGWTLEALATRMTAADCKMHPSTLHKIEKGDPPRKITVTELLAFSRVFEMPLAELVADPDVYLPRHIFGLVERAARLEQKRMRIEEEAGEVALEVIHVLREARETVQEHPEHTAAVDQLIARVSDAESAGDPNSMYAPRSLAAMWEETSAPFEQHQVIAFASTYGPIRRAGYSQRSAMAQTLDRGGWTEEQGAGLLAAAQARGFVHDETEEQR